MENDRSDALEAALTELRFVRDLPHPEKLPGSHLTDSGRAQLAFAAIDNVKRRADQCIKAVEDMTTGDKCPICAEPLKPTDMCLSDIEMGAVHAACLEGSPMVDLDTGEPLPEGATPPKPYPYSDLFPPRAENAQVAEPVDSEWRERFLADDSGLPAPASPPAPQAEVTEAKFAKRYFIQERDDDMLICAEHWNFGSVCIARRPKLATNDEWRPTAQNIIVALSIGESGR